MILLVGLVACGGAPQRVARPTTGAIAGLVRDRDTGDPIAKADLRITSFAGGRPAGSGGPSRSVVSGENGLYDIDHLSPGKYALVAVFAGQPIEISNIDVTAGQVTMVDIVFTLGRPEPIKVDFGNAKESAIERYRPSKSAPQVAIIEGTVSDTATKQRVPGAVVTAIIGDDPNKTQQTVSDDYGRFRFETLPGTYSVSAYYSVGGRGQIEVRRSNIAVEGAEAVHVPLFIEMNR
jgi:hypothetical protein